MNILIIKFRCDSDPRESSFVIWFSTCYLFVSLFLHCISHNRVFFYYTWKTYANSDANDDWLKLLTIIFSNITRKETAKMSYWEIKEIMKILILFLWFSMFKSAKKTISWWIFFFNSPQNALPNTLLFLTDDFTRDWQVTLNTRNPFATRKQFIFGCWPLTPRDNLIVCNLQHANVTRPRESTHPCLPGRLHPQWQKNARPSSPQAGSPMTHGKSSTLSTRAEDGADWEPTGKAASCLSEFPPGGESGTTPRYDTHDEWQQSKRKHIKSGQGMETEGLHLINGFWRRWSIYVQIRPVSEYHPRSGHPRSVPDRRNIADSQTAQWHHTNQQYCPNHSNSSLICHKCTSNTSCDQPASPNIFRRDAPAHRDTTRRSEILEWGSSTPSVLTSSLWFRETRRTRSAAGSTREEQR